MPKHFVTPANRVCYCPQCAPAWRAWGKVMRALARSECIGNEPDKHDSLR